LSTLLLKEQCGPPKLNFVTNFIYVDSFAASLALDHKATLATGDGDFKVVGNSIAIPWLKN
jgi:hypothetical protein